VRSLRREGAGFRAVTAGGEVVARNVVVATGPFQKPVFPAMIPENAGVMQIHSNGYRNPGQLPAGAVLVIGAGSSGAQIADELLRSGREVYLSVGPHDRPPRAYRGKDFVWWLGALGKWDARAQTPGTEHVTIAVSGALGGHTVDFRNLGNRGMKLVGRTDRCEGGLLHFAPDLAENIARGDANYLSVLDEADAHVAREGLELPEEPGARVFEPVPDCVTNPILSLDLKAAGVSAVIWATGYVLDFGWIEMDIFDEKGRPRHDKGVSEVPGLYFLGLPWLSRRASPFIWGVWHDADHLAGVIAGEGA
jgi:putative flavoprotein involved in K+ transport